MNAIPLLTNDPDADRLVRVLDEIGRSKPMAVALMHEIGIQFEQEDGDAWKPVFPNSAFVTFINIAMRARAALWAYGLVLMRTGGRPCDRYWIEQIRSS